jgi:hypothetical protein
MSSNKPSAKKKTSRAETLEALKLESEKNLREQIDRQLAKPIQERTHFLRKRIGFSGSAI